MICAYPMAALAKAGVRSVVINTGWLGDQIPAAFGDAFAVEGSARVALRYSHEGRGAGEALETAGGIVRALPLLDDVFWVAAGDVYAPDFAFSPEAFERFKTSPQLAHLWLVPNPAHNTGGDFGLSTDGMALNVPRNAGHHLFTFSTMALYKQDFFADCGLPPGNPDGVALAAGDRDAFVAAELAEREAAFLPPYGRLAAIILSSENAVAVEKLARELAGSIPNAERLEVYGPADAPLALVRGRRRKRLLVRADRDVDLQGFLRAWLARVKVPGSVRLTVDVDPYSFL
jgi:hypothetical protein